MVWLVVARCGVVGGGWMWCGLVAVGGGYWFGGVFGDETFWW